MRNWVTPELFSWNVKNGSPSCIKCGIIMFYIEGCGDKGYLCCQCGRIIKLARN
jgi:hypothetical protein